ncbi:FIG004556: membrane metalloprotease [hydrothermal vent metagenome]|uniref:FIG004556: membrane metalloprotease n=1 Tax=hydrothermal vent metagenome TaxID=652676 RepID=A0A3B0VGJ3_9ZZZZ
MSILQEIIILGPPLLFALTLHEYAHGYVARLFGDPTAANMGRLTLNPLKHLDPIGVICFILIKIGWAKPVPVDPRYFKDPRRDMIWVSLAGPGINFILAVISVLMVRLLFATSTLWPFFIISPLIKMLGASIWINLLLAVFNLLPLPPLDGSKILMGLLPERTAVAYARVEPYGFIIMLVLFYTGILPKIILPIISFAQRLIM